MKIDQYDLICFDWDGTLVNSHEIYRKCDQFLICNNYNKQCSISDLENIVSTYWSKYGVNGLNRYYQDWAKLFNNCIDIPINKTGFQDFLKDIEYKDNAVDALKKIKFNYPHIKLALVTGSRRSEINLYSQPTSNTGKVLKPNDFFDFIVTKDDVSSTKPNPESYQKAIDYFNMVENLDRILVVEDSMIGAISAYLAGIKNIGIIFDSHSDFEKCDLQKFNKFYWVAWKDFEKELLNG